MASDSKPGVARVQISIVWVPSQWLQPPVSGGGAAFALGPGNALAIHRVDLSVPDGQSVTGCLDQYLTKHALECLSQRSHGASIWGRRISKSQKISAGDRIELLGPITADPKSERRARVKAERKSLAGNRWR